MKNKKLLISKQTIKTLTTKTNIKTGRPTGGGGDDGTVSDVCSTAR